MPIIEVCVESLEAAEIAIDAGADRIEINSNLAADGLTPDFKILPILTRQYATPIVAMLRPHANGFIYSAADRKRIEEDCLRLLECEVAAIAFGALNSNGELDLPLIERIQELARGRELVLHRAFDLLVDQFQALDQLIELGVPRVLTSGGAPSAEAGMDQLRRLVDHSRGRIEVLPAAGIHLHNAQRILTYTGCSQVHGTFKRRVHGTFGSPSPGPVVPDREAIAQLKLQWKG